MSEAAEEAKKEFAKQAVALIFMVLALLIMTAVHDPDFFRTQKMRIAEKSRVILDGAARRLGHTSMGTELRTGKQKYEVPFTLAKLRDRVTRYYESQRSN